MIPTTPDKPEPTHHETGHSSRVVVVMIAVLLFIVSCAHREGEMSQQEPAILRASEAHSDFGMVSTGSEEATRAGVQILEQGGNAIDAAVAAAFALGVADPGGSGLGGMTYILFSPAEGRAIAIDGTVTVPVATDRAVLGELRKSGEPFGARAIAVPATLAALSHALDRYGTMELDTVLAPAIRFAEEGYRLNANSIAWAAGYFDEILASRYLRFLVLDEGERIGSVGDRICSPDLATTLRGLARTGADDFYRGNIARRMLTDLAALGGYLQPVDLALVRAKEINPLLSRYRGAEVISYPWPGGGAEVAGALQILENFPPEFLRRPSVERLHVMIETSRIVQADFLEFILSPLPPALGSANFLSASDARNRADLITPGRAIPEDALQKSPATARMGEHTTHVSVADRWGNAVSLTQTLCRQYGTKIATPGLGFPYNSCLEFYDFENPNSPFFLSPRARYSSTMAPTIVRRDGVLLILGSAGSDRIPGSVVEVISNVIDRDMGIRDAVIAPRVLWNGLHDPPRVCLEIADPVTEEDADTLQSWGFEHQFRLVPTGVLVADSGYFGGVNAVLFDPANGIFSGVGDPRRSGYAEGPRAGAERQERP